jgi:hypothetical protein
MTTAISSALKQLAEKIDGYPPTDAVDSLIEDVEVRSTSKFVPGYIVLTGSVVRINLPRFVGDYSQGMEGKTYSPPKSSI